MNNLIILSLSSLRLILFCSFAVFCSFPCIFLTRWHIWRHDVYAFYMSFHTHEFPPPDSVTFMQTRRSLLAHFTRGVEGVTGWHRCPRACTLSTLYFMLTGAAGAHESGQEEQIYTTHWCNITKYIRGLIKNVPKERLKCMLVDFGAHQWRLKCFEIKKEVSFVFCPLWRPAGNFALCPAFFTLGILWYWDALHLLNEDWEYCFNIYEIFTQMGLQNWCLHLFSVVFRPVTLELLIISRPEFGPTFVTV